MVACWYGLALQVGYLFPFRTPILKLRDQIQVGVNFFMYLPFQDSTRQQWHYWIFSVNYKILNNCVLGIMVKASTCDCFFSVASMVFPLLILSPLNPSLYLLPLLQKSPISSRTFSTCDLLSTFSKSPGALIKNSNPWI
jgi:hypothetical protein